MSDLRTFFAGTEPWMAAASVTEYGDPVADRDLLAALSPMTTLERLTSPVLLVHGDRDTNVPVAESVQAHQALQARGAPSDLLLLPGEGHTIVGRDHLVELSGARRRLVRSLAVSRDLFADYPAAPADEAVDPDGRLRDELRRARAGLQRAGDRRTDRGRDGAGRRAGRARGDRRVLGRRPADRAALPAGPVPRVVRAADWAAVAAGVEQRHRALNAFLADAYRAAGPPPRRRRPGARGRARRRAAGVGGRAQPRPPADAVGQAWPGQPRAAARRDRPAAHRRRRLGGCRRPPAGAGRPRLRAGQPRQRPRPPCRSSSRRRPGRSRGTPCRCCAPGLAAAAPPACAGAPRIAVLTAGESDNAWFEHRLLADALGVPLARAADLWPRTGRRGRGRRRRRAAPGRRALPPLRRRHARGLPDADRAVAGRAAHRGGAGGPARAGQRPGNGLADDAAAYAWVPTMIRFYLGEEPLLGSVPTWVLADEGQWAQVRDRLHELVVKPVAGYGGRGTVFGPSCSAAELAALQAEVAAAPYRFVAQEPVEATPRRPWSTASCSPAGWTCGCSRSPGPAARPRTARAADPRGARCGAVGSRPRHQGHLADLEALDHVLDAGGQRADVVGVDGREHARRAAGCGPACGRARRRRRRWRAGSSRPPPRPPSRRSRSCPRPASGARGRSRTGSRTPTSPPSRRAGRRSPWCARRRPRARRGTAATGSGRPAGTAWRRRGCCTSGPCWSCRRRSTGPGSRGSSGLTP